ncbi:MAG: hypothetical protein GXO79_11535, partial [Chlorobi bacterium]|nr:hypothetical protein [Chlorobiota bacterium]
MLKGNSVAGLHLKYISEKEKFFDVVILKKQKTQINIYNTNTNIDSIAKISKQIGQIPACLSIEGKGILLKKIDSSEKNNNQQILDKFFPNAVEENFYIQKTEIDDEETFIAIARKSIIDSIIQELYSQNIWIIDLTFGPFNLNRIIPLFSGKYNEIILPETIINLNNDRIGNIEKKFTEGDYNYLIENERIDASILLPYASALKYYIFNVNNELVIKQIKNKKNEFKFKMFFKFYSKSILAGIFLILLINYLLFDGFDKKNKLLNDQYNKNEYLLNKIDKLSKEL